VAQRVSEGGHNVPSDKIIKRIPRLLKNIKTALPLCDDIYFLDNSRLDNPFQQVVTIREQQVKVLTKDLPDWADYLLKKS